MSDTKKIYVAPEFKALLEKRRLELCEKLNTHVSIPDTTKVMAKNNELGKIDVMLIKRRGRGGIKLDLKLI